MARNAITVWDFTIPQDKGTVDEVKSKLNQYCKAWCFQLEKGAKTGYMHYQGRVSLKVKARKAPAIYDGMKWLPTSDANKDNFYYVDKEDTRVEGPWKDTDPVTYLPRQFRDINLYEWQKTIKDSANIFEPRKLDLIYDSEGGKGKSTIASICEILHGGIDMPPLNDFKEIIALACDICIERNTRDPKIMFFDLPRALDKDRLNGLYSAIEQIKKGKLYDCRYKYKSWWIDSPRCWVFSNHLPDTTMLSADRWNIWTINKKTNQLERFRGDAEASVTIRKRLLP